MERLRFPHWILISSVAALVYLRLQPIPVVSPWQNTISISEKTKLVMSSVVTLLVLLSSLYVILAKKYTDADKKWAYGAIGTILGYWLGR
jgi:hypothetical protein